MPNSWLQAGSYVTVSGDRLAMFYAANAAAVSYVTATWSGGIAATVPVVVYEISGAATSNPLDANASNPATSTQTSGTHSSFASSSSLVTNNASDILMFGMGASTTLSTEAAGSGYTLTSGGNTANGRACMITKIVAASGAQAATSITFTSATVRNTGIFAAFQASGTLAVVQAKNNSVVGSETVVTIASTAGNLLVMIAYQGVNSTSTLTVTDSTFYGGWPIPTAGPSWAI